MNAARMLFHRPIIMKLFESDKFAVLTDQLERVAYQLAECGREIYGEPVPTETLIAAALTRVSGSGCEL